MARDVNTLVSFIAFVEYSVVARSMGVERELEEKFQFINVFETAQENITPKP